MDDIIRYIDNCEYAAIMSNMFNPYCVVYFVLFVFVLCLRYPMFPVFSVSLQ